MKQWIPKETKDEIYNSKSKSRQQVDKERREKKLEENRPITESLKDKVKMFFS